MPRPERPLDPLAGPIAAFAADLRRLRTSAGSPKYLQMARRTGRSRTALTEAAGGDHLPTWETVEAFVRACNGDPNDWRERWEKAKESGRIAAQPVPNIAPLDADATKQAAAQFSSPDSPRDKSAARVDQQRREPGIRPGVSDGARFLWRRARRPALLSVAGLILLLLGAAAPLPRVLPGVFDFGPDKHVHVAVPAAETLVAFSRFGKFAAGNFAVSGASGVVEIWDTRATARRHTLDTGDDQVTDVQFDPLNRNVLATAGTNGLLRLWDTVAGKPTLSILCQRAGSRMIFAYDPRRRGIVATVGERGVVQVRQTATGEVVREINTGFAGITALAFDAHNEGHLAVGGDGGLRIWNSKDGAVVSVTERIRGRITTLKFDPLTRNTLAVATTAAPVGIWDASNGRHVRYMLSDARPAATAFNPLIRNSLAADDGHGLMQIFDSSNGVRVHTLDGNHGPITSMEYSPDGEILAVGGRDGVVRLHSVEDW